MTTRELVRQCAKEAGFTDEEITKMAEHADTKNPEAVAATHEQIPDKELAAVTEVVTEAVKNAVMMKAIRLFTALGPARGDL